MSTVPAFAPRPLSRPVSRPLGRREGRPQARARLAVVPRRRVRAARMPFVTLVSLVLLGGVVGLLCFNTQMQQASFAETKLQAQADTLAARQQTLHDQVQALRDPQHLARAAQHAGMVIPETACTITVGAAAGGASRPDDTNCTAATRANTPPLDGRAPGKPAALAPKPHVTKVQAPVTTTSTTPVTPVTPAG